MQHNPGWLAVFACVACSATPPAQSPPVESPAPQASAAAPAPPALPSPTLAVPEGNRLAFALDASGVQIYGCQASEQGPAWTLQAPEASLVAHGESGPAQVKHYAGPTWEWLADGSKVTAKKVAAFSEDPAAIPALLLQVSGHEGQGQLSDVSYIQRLSTKQGLAPSSGCDAAHVGDVARSDYTATYYLYRATPPAGDPAH